MAPSWATLGTSRELVRDCDRDEHLIGDALIAMRSREAIREQHNSLRCRLARNIGGTAEELVLRAGGVLTALQGAHYWGDHNETKMDTTRR